MKYFKFILLISLLLFSNQLYSKDKIQKPKVYHGENVSGWFMSEKLDGIRGCWTGKRMLTRKGIEINCPKWFLKNFPSYKLDGELWISRNNFEAVQSTVMDKIPGKSWKKVTYNIFEVPNAKGNFLQRLDKAKMWFEQNRNSFAQIIPQLYCKDSNALNSFLNDIESKGGEGVIVKDPKKTYHTGRSKYVLKVKRFRDMEGFVVAVNEGKGKFKGLMGSLTVKISDGNIFKIGTGFTDENRKNPPKKGAVVTFKYYGFTKNGIPKFASFMRVRKD
ncbi:MAG: DNA ligase [Desulfobacterales bacterium]|nr:DNA ligase [Desulfobacterales bacterium]MCP4162423.1 DNA ligase [Deltaproteobacteria bacterium]